MVSPMLVDHPPANGRSLSYSLSTVIRSDWESIHCISGIAFPSITTSTLEFFCWCYISPTSLWCHHLLFFFIEIRYNNNSFYASMQVQALDVFEDLYFKTLCRLFRDAISNECVRIFFLSLKWPTTGLFLFIFVLFKHFYKKTTGFKHGLTTWPPPPLPQFIFLKETSLVIRKVLVYILCPYDVFYFQFVFLFLGYSSPSVTSCVI